MGLDYPWAFDGSDIFQGVAMALGLKGLLLKGSRNVIQVWGIIICTVSKSFFGQFLWSINEFSEDVHLRFVVVSKALG